ncbi:transposase [Candidatus Woesearchaeota archaeon]|nr:transposase [Candidatus Woesearchaeota archaeon]
MAYTKEFKLRIIKHVRMGITPIEHIATIRKIPKQTIYRWLKSIRRYGESGLENGCPGAKPFQINVTAQQMILVRWKKRPRGSAKLWRELKEEGFGISQRQIQKAYNQHGLRMNKRERPSQLKFVKYEWPKPNMLWHTDWTICPFTGNHLIAFIDDNSRYIVHAELFNSPTTENTLLAFRAAIAKHGKPEAILTDNGTQFTPARASKGPFSQWCEEQGIRHIIGRVNHPQTNGKIERWFGTYKQEKKQEEPLDSFVKYYNDERLHQGINYKVPSERYKSNINAV